MPGKDPSNLNKLVDHLFRHQAGRMISALTRVFGIHNLELAEDIVQDTIHQALIDWRWGYIPDNPAGWLMTVAKRKAINRLKRENFYQYFADGPDQQLPLNGAAYPSLDTIFLENEIKDSQLRMIFTCCNPRIQKESQVALTLKILCGFSVKEIANSLLTNEDTLCKRLYRAKEKMKNLEIAFEIPVGKELNSRLDAVYLVIYLLFNEGYNSSSNDLIIRKDLCAEAMRLGTLLTEAPLDQYPKTYALLALMYFHIARFDARVNGEGAAILLEDQDRRLWDKALIKKGFSFLSRSANRNEISEYHIEAAIAGQHCLAKNFGETDWTSILSLYEHLEKIKPSPVIALNKTIVIGKIEGPQRSIELLHQLENDKTLSTYFLLPASLGEFYLKVDDKGKAREYFQKAKSLTCSKAENEVLDKKIRACL